MFANTRNPVNVSVNLYFIILIIFFLFNFTHLDSADCKFFTDSKVAARTALPQIWDKPVRNRT